MNANGTLPEGIEKKSFSLKDVVSFVIPLLFIAIFVLIVYTINHNYPTSGDAVIRQVAGKMLDKDPNSLDKKDFLQIEELDLSGCKIADIRLLKEFTNLRKLDISRLNVPDARTPVWKQLLIKLNIVEDPAKKRNYSKKKVVTYLNLRPLRNLSKLESLNMNFTPIGSLDSLTCLKNLTVLNVYGTDVFELGPVKKLSNLETLNISQTQIIDIKPLQGLTKLHRLTFYNTAIRDIEPVKNIPSLIYLDIRKSKNILHSQIDDLQKSLPELIIFDDRDK